MNNLLGHAWKRPGAASNRSRMRHRELQAQLDRLESLLDRTDEATGGNIELMGHWGRYLCVLVAGLLENALREVYSSYVRRVARPPVANYSSRTLESISNPKANRFIETASGFNEEWAEELELFLDEEDERRRNAIDSIMNNRHQIAHGKMPGISVVRVKEYLAGCVEVIEFIEDQLR